MNVLTQLPTTFYSDMTFQASSTRVGRP